MLEAFDRAGDICLVVRGGDATSHDRSDEDTLIIEIESTSSTETNFIVSLSSQKIRGSVKRRAKKSFGAVLEAINERLPKFLVESKDPFRLVNEGWRVFESGDTKLALELYRRVFESLVLEKDLSLHFSGGLYFFGAEDTSFFYVCDVNNETLILGVEEKHMEVARNNLGVFLSHIGDQATALTIWRLNGNCHYSLFNLGEHERRNGRLPEAVHYFTRATEGGNESSSLMSYAVNALLPEGNRRTVNLDTYDDEARFNVALEYVNCELSRTNDQIYAYARYILASNWPDRLQPTKQDADALSDYDPTAFYLRGLSKKDRAEMMTDVVAAANEGNIYALDALLRDASNRDNLMEVDHWSRRKQELLAASRKLSNERPGPAAAASVLKRVGVTNQAAAAGVVGVMAYAAITRFTMRNVAENLGNLGENLGISESIDSFGGESVEADAGGMDFGDFF
jgi:hypothetical protein